MKKSSPFGFFRDNQRMFLAVFGVLILVVFTVGPSLQSYQSTQGGGGGNAPVVQWDPWSVPVLGKIWIVGKFFRGSKSVTENELARLRNMHIMAHNVLGAIRPPIDSGTVPPLPHPNNTGDEYLVNLRIVEDKAKDLGIVVTDQMIDDYLTAYSNSDIEIKHSKLLNRLEGDLGKTLAKTTGGQMTELQFYNQMRRELTYYHVTSRLAASGTSDISFPGDLWAAHQYNQRNLEVEYVEFEAASYVDETSKEPSEEDSRIFYKRHQDSEQDPFPFQTNHFYPGFRYPEQVDFGYLHISYQDDIFQPAMEAAKAAITDEQIQTYYDEHKINYIKVPDIKPADKPEDKKPEDKKPEDKKPEDKKPEDKKPEDKKPEDKKPEDKKPEDKKPEDKKPEDKKPEDKKPEDKKPEDKKPEDKKPEDKKPEDKKPEDKPADKKPAGQGSRPTPNLNQLRQPAS